MEALRKPRSTVKSKMTKLQRKVDTERNSGQSISREKIEVYLARLEEIHCEFDDVQRKILAAHEGEPSVLDATEEQTFTDRYHNLKILLKEILVSVTATQAEARLSQSDDVLIRVLQQQSELMQRFGDNGGGSQASAASSEAITQLVPQQTELLRRFTDGGGAARNESNVKLPIVTLPTFDGRTEEWKRFSETFQSLIHTNTGISNNQKFQYLITSLSGATPKIIESIELTNDNYTVAWELLKKRYEDPRAIKKKHIPCLFMMPRVEKESSSAIRELVDYTQNHLRILKSMDLPTDTWHELIIHMIESKLDIGTLRVWEQNGTAANGKMEDLTDFLESRCQTLERIEARGQQKDVTSNSESEKKQSKPRGKGKSTRNEKPAALATTAEVGKCFLCQGEHFLYRCEKFLAMLVDVRVKEVQRMRLCLNCLRNDHFVKACRMGSCKECTQRHNTLLHLPDVKEGSSVKVTDADSSNKSSNVSVHHASNSPKKRHVIMATAIVNAARVNGSNVAIRILLDSGSEANFVTHSACTKLGVKRDKTSEIVTGLNEMESKISQSCDIVVQSRYSNYSINVRCFVVPTITKNLPSVEIERNAIQIPSNVKLADVEFHKPSAIDMLLGAEFFFDLLQAEKIDLGGNHPMLQNTKLGWVVAGSIGRDHTTSVTCTRSAIATLNCSLEHCETLNKNLERFWEVETVQSETNRVFSADEQQCEEFFDQTTFRDDEGRFVVRLPFRENPSELGRSQEIARRRLGQLERRFAKNQTLRDRYIGFMREYQEFGHMSPANEVSRDTERPVVYLPHLGVNKESSSSTKLRTVVDASSKTDSGVALNDILHVGPTLQSSLIEIVMRFRFHNIALTGDLRKMYRQIIVHPDDRDYKRILWREAPDEQVKEFRLNTVTYGEASSVYLAMKCVRRLAEQAHEYPIAARVILDEMYVDDIMTGADDVQGIIAVQQQLTALLQTGGFEIHKWCSNRSESLPYVPQDRREDVATHRIDSNDTIKTLGLEWNPHDDNFQFSMQQAEAATTKRLILSAISKFFDPLGLIGPILTSAKLLMQETWRIDCNWDETLPTAFIEKWELFRQKLNAVKLNQRDYFFKDSATPQRERMALAYTFRPKTRMVY